jgi:hypothetical protein
MDTTEIEAAFRDWWEESYKRPPNAQAVMTHVAFAAHVPVDGVLEVTMILAHWRLGKASGPRMLTA